MRPAHSSEGAKGPTLEEAAELDADPLHDVAADAPVPAIVDLGGRGVRVAREVLHVLDGDALGQQVRDNHHPEAVRGEHLREPGVLEAALEEAADGPGADAARPETGRGVEVRRAEERGSLGIIGDPGRRDVLREPAIQVDADRDLPLLPTLLAEPEGTVLPVVAKVLEAQLGDRADASPRVGQGADDGAIAEPHRPRAIHGREELTGLLHGDLGGLPAPGILARPPDGEEGIEHNGVARHEDVEELAERREGHLLAGDRRAIPVDEASGGARTDLLERETVLLAPLQELANGPAVGPPRVDVPHSGGEELVRGEARLGARLPEDRGKEAGRRPNERGRIGGVLGGRHTTIIHFII